MLIDLQLALLLGALLPGSAKAAVPYRLVPPPLDTPWTEKVGTNPWPQYPRPQLRRDVWQSLNGIWTYQAAKGAGDVASPPTLPLNQEVLIPSCIESGLSGIMTIGVTHMWFGTTFTVPRRWTDGRRVLLNFEAVDYEATVLVNGDEVGFNRGGYSRFSLDITDSLIDGDNELMVFVFDPTDDQSIPQGKQTKRMSHIFYTPCSGIWQTVWLESFPDNFITSLDVSADMEGHVDVVVHSHTKTSRPVEITVEDAKGHVVGSHQHASDQPIRFTVPSPKLWSPDSPTLYNITVKMGDDEVQSYTGFRTISSGVINGIKRPLLNGEFVFRGSGV
ncbi:galactose-binding domain-like protein [Parachaetomium inaequale]|uniref:Galactose-binding domain-like protein n=1 Tax=Parachaetomium inaequale TaxID=2588326 RepID=A0AAN6PBI4_9PEZI|nr:galactose-binding domain-like protein [Parachaetomium inaequale]